MREGLAVAVPVRIGIVSEEVAEVLAGLEVGDRVIVGEAAAYENGRKSTASNVLTFEIETAPPTGRLVSQPIGAPGSRSVPQDEASFAALPSEDRATLELGQEIIALAEAAQTSGTV